FTATPPFEASAQHAPAYVQPSRRGYSRAYLPRTEHPYTYTAIFARHRARPTSTIRCARAHTMAAGLSDSLHDARRYAATTTPESKRLAWSDHEHTPLGVLSRGAGREPRATHATQQ